METCSKHSEKVHGYATKTGKCSLSGGLMILGDSGGMSTTQSYDLMCIVPKSSLLKTVIPG